MPEQKVTPSNSDLESELFADLEHDLFPSHERGKAPEARPIATGGGRGTGLDVRRSDAWAKKNAPAIGAGLAVAAGPSGILPRLALAGGGGYLGARARGDERPNATVQGILQAGLEGGAALAVGTGQTIAHGLMKGAVPKNIAKDFQGQVDIPSEMLERGALPGVPASQRRISRLSTAANAERDAAAKMVPTMSRSKVVEGLRPAYQKGATGKVPEMSEATLEQMRKSAREIGPEGLEGPQALARKDIKQAQGNAAQTSSDSRTAAFGSQLADMERGAIVSHMRETPRMATALDESQTLMAIDQVMKDAALSNPVTRARIGGVTAAAMSPLGLGITAHGVNQASRTVSPQMIRALQLALLRGEQ